MKENNKVIYRCLTVVVFLSFLCSIPVFAKDCGGVETALIECSEGGDGGIWHLINLIIDILSIGVGIAGVIGILVAGVQYLTSGPNVDRVQKAKNRIYQVVLGLVAYVFLFAGLQWLLPGGTFRQEIGIESFSLDKTSVSVQVGKSEAVKTIFAPEDVSDKTVTWKSNDTGIATVSSNGVVTGKKAGTVTITAIASDGSEAHTNVTVSPATNGTGSSGSSGGSSGGGSSMSGKTNVEIRNELSKVAVRFAKKKNRTEYQQAIKTTGVYDGKGGTGGYCRKIGQSCSAYVATVVRTVIRDGTGKKWPANTAKIPDYVDKVNAKYPGTWKKLSSNAKKEPGDILYEYDSFGSNGHTAIFVENSNGQTVIAEAAVATSYTSTWCGDNAQWPHITTFKSGPLYHKGVTYYRYMGGS